MTKFRRNHQKVSGGTSSIVRMVLFAVVLCVLMYMLYQFINLENTVSNSESQDLVLASDYNQSAEGGGGIHSISEGCQLIQHKHYNISYCEDHESSEWVSYTLSQKLLQAPNVRRAKRFEMDPLISTESAHHGDYTRSGYTRGHLAPAGDMAFSEEAMSESFFMSNMSPQIRPFNNGIWKELEEQFRDWVYQNESLTMVTGPVLSDDGLKQIGKRNKVTVAKRFYKVILDDTGKKRKAIAFLLPHEKTEKRLQDFAMSVDDLEAELGMDFFQNVANQKEIEKLEASFNLRDWKFSDARYRLRVDKWNNQ